MSVNTEMNLGEAWRKALQDEISKPMKPVPGRIAFLKGLGYLEEELRKIPTKIRSDGLERVWRIQIGADNDVDSQHEFSLTNATANGLDLEDDNVLSVDETKTVITAIDHAMDEVNWERSYIGSEQNKLQFTMSNLSSNIQSIESARSDIEDVDYASEMSELAKNQILVQSGTAMLAQANMVSQNILQLLGN